MTIDAMKQALAALETVTVDIKTTPNAYEAQRQAIAALRAAIEQAQEPVAWELRKGKTDRVLLEITNNPQRAHDWKASLEEVVPLYTAPRHCKPPRFPTMLRKMWSGSEVQKWIDENWEKKHE